MNITSANQDNIDLMLTQMGAKVQTLHGLLCFVRFEIHGNEIFYVYNVNMKDQYYLQKVLPYPVGAGVFTKTSDIVDYIKNDIQFYKNAEKNENVNNLIDINTQLHRLLHNVEDTFMKYKVSPDKIEEMSKAMMVLNDILTDIQETSGAASK
jgi:hypothetical protein